MPAPSCNHLRGWVLNFSDFPVPKHHKLPETLSETALGSYVGFWTVLRWSEEQGQMQFKRTVANHHCSCVQGPSHSTSMWTHTTPPESSWGWEQVMQQSTTGSGCLVRGKSTGSLLLRISRLRNGHLETPAHQYFSAVEVPPAASGAKRIPATPSCTNQVDFWREWKLMWGVCSHCKRQRCKRAAFSPLGES